MPWEWGIIYFIEGNVEYINAEGASWPGNGELYILLMVMQNILMQKGLYALGMGNYIFFEGNVEYI